MSSNFITETDHQKHTIKRYEFRSIDKKLEAEIAPAMEESGIYTPPSDNHNEDFAILQELLKEVLEQSSQNKASLQTLQEQMQNFSTSQQNQMLEEGKKSAYEQGVLDGEKRAKESLESEVEAQKQSLTYAINNLQDAIIQTQERIKTLESELSSIAIDLAKEVIIKEVQEESQKIAFHIAQELLEPISQSSEITLRANPIDLPYLQEKLPQASKIHFEPDALISRGGVIISSPLGNFDGTILSRYKNLKRTILEDKGL